MTLSQIRKVYQGIADRRQMFRLFDRHVQRPNRWQDDDSPLEHALGDFEGEQERFRQRLADARRRLASYRSRAGRDFAFAGELAEKRRQLAEIERALATDVQGIGGAVAA